MNWVFMCMLNIIMMNDIIYDEHARGRTLRLLANILSVTNVTVHNTHGTWVVNIIATLGF